MPRPGIQLNELLAAEADVSEKQFDVMTALDRLIGNARTMAGLSGDPRMRENLREGEKARATVDKLIQAAQRACDTWPATASVCGLRDALHNALGIAPNCDCPGGDKPANLHAPNCPVRVAANTEVKPSHEVASA